MDLLLGAAITLVILGMVFGIGLAIASDKFAVKVDPRIDRINEVLPGANCGACGQPGCSGFAQAVAVLAALAIHSPRPACWATACAICGVG
mgnify:CR=1 FL=1